MSSPFPGGSICPLRALFPLDNGALVMKSLLFPGYQRQDDGVLARLIGD